MRIKKILIIVGVVVLVAVGGGSAYFILTGGKSSETNSTPTTSNKNTVAPTKDLVALIEGNKGLANYNKLIVASGVKFTLQTVGTSYLVIATNNDGYKSLPAGYFDSILTTDKQAIAQDIAKYSVVILPSAELAKGQKLKTLDGKELIVGYTNKFTFTDSKGNTANEVGVANATNGKLYIVDSVILPQ
jgi:uncharacterized surface protein with fasciclin (FAS1) repeats